MTTTDRIIITETDPKYVGWGNTSSKGLLDGITFYALCDAFGAPHHQGWTGEVAEDKVQVLWTIEFTVESEDEDDRKVVATIYDWKNVTNPIFLTLWHIGGHSTEAVDLVKQYIQDNRQQ